MKYFTSYKITLLYIFQCELVHLFSSLESDRKGREAARGVLGAQLLTMFCIRRVEKSYAFSQEFLIHKLWTTF